MVTKSMYSLLCCPERHQNPNVGHSDLSPFRLEKSKHDISGYVGSGSAFACGALQLGYCVLALSLKDGLKLLTSVLDFWGYPRLQNQTPNV
ncbi:hypothetical protein PHAVU_010G147400 [Phaseolus vulgaris]|uniref:Uncharacterized protein n=1 Tax=Phaseolus vulgaris TaxID=3885 RepID=V7APT5_PHAVU|nr:hypothetical protein PHAVU_010G147400g [Phaseolus vulgaris]ESW07652.1 hypothetical protein PHAVU_010G147400g [Phaseolus vulgaris]